MKLRRFFLRGGGAVVSTCIKRLSLCVKNCDIITVSGAQSLLPDCCPAASILHITTSFCKFILPNTSHTVTFIFLCLTFM